MSADVAGQRQPDDALHTQLARLAQMVVVPADLPTNADDKNAKEALQGEGAFYARALHEQELADRSLARAQREKYARHIFWLVCGWIVLIFVLLLLQGFSGFIGYKPLNDSVLIALISSTTVNVIGTLIIVLKYIFNVPVLRPDDAPVSSTPLDSPVDSN